MSNLDSEATQVARPSTSGLGGRGQRSAIRMVSSGTVVSFTELDRSSSQVARLFGAFGLQRGDVIAILMENRPEFFAAAWGAQRSGLYYTAINYHLTTDEVQYILADSGARVLVTSSALGQILDPLERPPSLDHILAVDSGGPFEAFADLLSAHSDEPLTDEIQGCELLYSSGTTGRPKAIKRPLPPLGSLVATHQHAVEFWRDHYGMDATSVYLSPAPLYHAAPLITCMTTHRLGATTVVMERFDAVEALRSIDEFHVTHAQFVPTMFIRFLKLDADQRRRWDLASLRVAVHAAAPCPVDVKSAMIEWWGPILHEYYGGTEGIGTTMIDSYAWLDHPGSVGRPAGCTVHIVAADGAELPDGDIGNVYFESDAEFEYLGDAEKTASITDHRGWRTLGDVGYVDDQGYLYLTDRSSFMIVSGGVNIYPREVEDVLIAHTSVHDVAVFGVPNAEFGEEVKAVVQLTAGVQPNAALEDELRTWCRTKLASFKCPRSYDFVDELPRDPNGKLYKRRLRDPYWADRSQPDSRSGGATPAVP